MKVELLTVKSSPQLLIAEPSEFAVLLIKVVLFTDTNLPVLYIAAPPPVIFAFIKIKFLRTTLLPVTLNIRTLLFPAFASNV